MMSKSKIVMSIPIERWGYFFCDILDNYRVCRLVKEGSFLAEHGCCNVEKIGPKEFVKFRCNRPFK